MKGRLSISLLIRGRSSYPFMFSCSHETEWFTCLEVRVLVGSLEVRWRFLYFWILLSLGGGSCTYGFCWGSVTPSGSHPLVALPQENPLVQKPPFQSKLFSFCPHISRMCSPGVSVNCEFICWELHGTFSILTVNL